MLQADINKDSETSEEGKLVVPAGGKTLHDYARDLAVRETQRQWSQFQDELRRVSRK